MGESGLWYIPYRKHGKHNTDLCKVLIGKQLLLNVSIRLLIYEVIVINLSIAWYCLYSVSIAVLLPGGHTEAVGRKVLTKIISLKIK